jgi:hypothetical protein
LLLSRIVHVTRDLCGHGERGSLRDLSIDLIHLRRRGSNETGELRRWIRCAARLIEGVHQRSAARRKINIGERVVIKLECEQLCERFHPVSTSYRETNPGR